MRYPSAELGTARLYSYDGQSIGWVTCTAVVGTVVGKRPKWPQRQWYDSHDCMNSSQKSLGWICVILADKHLPFTRLTFQDILNFWPRRRELRPSLTLAIPRTRTSSLLPAFRHHTRQQCRRATQQHDKQIQYPKYDGRDAQRRHAIPTRSSWTRRDWTTRRCSAGQVCRRAGEQGCQDW